MPSRGDDFDAAIAEAIVQNLSNVEAMYTPPGSTHISTDTTCLLGVFTQSYDENGGVPTFKYHSCDLLLAPVLAAKLRVGNEEYTVRQIASNKRDITTFTLEFMGNVA